jgi:hypothetical protein
VGLNDAPARGLHRVLVGDRPVPGRPITIAPMLPKKAWKSISGVKYGSSQPTPPSASAM